MTTPNPQPPEACAVQEAATRAAKLANDFLEAIRQLKRASTQCTRCLFADTCTAGEKFNAQIDAAINELLTEWGME